MSNKVYLQMNKTKSLKCWEKDKQSQLKNQVEIQSWLTNKVDEQIKLIDK